MFVARVRVGVRRHVDIRVADVERHQPQPKTLIVSELQLGRIVSRCIGFCMCEGEDIPLNKILHWHRSAWNQEHNNKLGERHATVEMTKNNSQLSQNHGSLSTNPFV